MIFKWGFIEKKNRFGQSRPGHLWSSRAVGTGGGGGILTDQTILSQPEGQIILTTLLLAPHPHGFSDLPTALSSTY